MSSERRDNSGRFPWKKWVKKFTHRKNRRATKEKLDHDKTDDIPQNKPTKEEDPWGWTDMKHVMQPNRWSCSIASAAMVMDVPIAELIEGIGHDGSEEVFPELGPPMMYAGFDISEIVDEALRRGWSTTHIETMPRCTPDGVNVRDVYPESKLMERFEWYLNRFDGIAYGQRIGMTNWHVIAWSKEERRWHDPSGPVLQHDKPSISIASFYAFCKNEHYIASQMLQQLISRE